MRIRVKDVLDLLGAGLTFEQILAEMPDLESEDILASIQLAARRVNLVLTQSVAVNAR